ncbi:Lipopolysaccharide heptosyltransferase 1 [Georgfuchsia toluolica]|uniref:Lipopolysaccharide heptosyltransferase 1 n=1 Tax=Georgfuchsia toluolica TaxID=424218 RepID=A0A916J7P0_9PROT|nr:lipopolysaccharide heptosyltransferase I [Georgfuchsia toluolica]CAG4884700.1 Lipopolysaccharide heptosyltransferase 1 [Georgfuchsia toluolica]
MHALLVKTSSLGDVVHNLPVVTDIQRHYPGAVIDWVVEEAFADIPRLHPGVHRVIPVALRRWRKRLFTAATWREMAAFRRGLRHDAYDVVLDTQGLIKSALIARQAQLAAHGRRLGFDAATAREPLAARFYDAGFMIAKNAHAIGRNRRLAAAAFDYTLNTPLDYGIAAPPLATSWLPARPYAVLLTGTSRADKLWPESYWVALAKALNVSVILPAGSAAERERAQRLAAQMPGARAVPPLGIAELAGLMAGAQIVIGLDTGLTHLAAALNKPTLAIFSGSAPELTGAHAGDMLANAAINLGRNGAPPTVAEVIATARGLLR